MKSAIQRWGNSLALRIPSAFADEANLSAGSAVDLTVSRHRLIVTTGTKKYRLGDLVRKIKPGQLHVEQFDDGPVGREIW